MSNPIDYQSPTDQINDVLFDVSLQEVYYNTQQPNTIFKQQVTAPHYKAVINQHNGKIVSIVGNGYRLIPNKDALAMGMELFSGLYPHVNVDELIPYKVVAPASKASVHIDLIHKDVNFSVWEQEYWLPFLRVTNSYNRTYALAFEIGFVRKLCSNGVLFNKKSTKIKYVHSISKALNLHNEVTKIGEVSEQFINQCKRIHEFVIPREMMFALVCHMLRLNLKSPESKTKLMNLESLFDLTNTLTTKYSNGSQVNAYTALNVATDIVSHQHEYKNLNGYYLNARSFYARPADWMEGFTAQIQNSNFTLNAYLEPTVNALKELEDGVGFQWRLN